MTCVGNEEIHVVDKKHFESTFFLTDVKAKLFKISKTFLGLSLKLTGKQKAKCETWSLTYLLCSMILLFQLRRFFRNDVFTFARTSKLENRSEFIGLHFARDI